MPKRDYPENKTMENVIDQENTFTYKTSTESGMMESLCAGIIGMGVAYPVYRRSVKKAKATK